MSYNKTRSKQAKLIRYLRKIHRYTGVALFVFFFIIAVSGFFLGLKNNFNGAILPKTMKGQSSNLATWKPIHQLEEKAVAVLKDSVSPKLSTNLSRIDIRQQKGIVKFIFEEHLYEIQLDGKTGQVLQIGKRNSDLLEDIHDGSILDTFFNTKNSYFKITYSTLMSTALLVFTLTGFWLWYGPKRMKKRK
ncbi:MAG TPA: PepSY-associated TM helix domain-containing protein [Flavobacteriaceae bacterium]|nr:PepSY-associated TM helix domain-containing protein [Flavobacteriaceae bacterium]